MLKIEADSHFNTLRLQCNSSLSAENTRVLTDRYGHLVERASPIRGLLFVLDPMPPWRDLRNFLEQVRFLREQGASISRLAIISSSPANTFLSDLQKHWPQCEIRLFTSAQENLANAWLQDAEAANTANSNEQSAADAASQNADEEYSLDVGNLDQPDETDDWFVKN